jgi:glycosyltransferase involved in cell wall biosynthesis
MHTPTEQTAPLCISDQPLTFRHWSINGRFLGRNITGVDRYAREILRAMDALIGEGHPLAAGLTLDILCPDGAIGESPFANISLRVLPKVPGHLWEQFILTGYLRGGLLSLCNTGPLAVRRQIVCIHDVNTRLTPESYGLMFRVTYRLLQPALGRCAARIVTVSRFSQKAMAQFGIARAEEIDVIHDGYEHVLDWKPDCSPLNAANLPGPFVLLVGSKAPHKNTAIIYSIAADLAARGIHVLVTGGADANVYAHEYGGQLPPNVRRLGRVNDNDLAFLYRHALCLVFPSKTEGFGLPALEAMALGCPVISSDAASLPEVCGEAVLYAPPDDGAAWLAAIGRISTEPALRETLVVAGPKRSKAFSWREGAEKYLQLMYALDNGTRNKLLLEKAANRTRVVGIEEHERAPKPKSNLGGNPE